MAAARESIRNVVCGNLQWPGAAQAVASAQYVTGRLTLATSCINCQRPAGLHATLSTCTARPIRSASTRLLAQLEYRPVLSGMISRSSSAPGFNGSTSLSGVTDGGYQQVQMVGPISTSVRPESCVQFSEVGCQLSTQPAGQISTLVIRERLPIPKAVVRRTTHQRRTLDGLAIRLTVRVDWR
jgi:hypothetical protein